MPDPSSPAPATYEHRPKPYSNPLTLTLKGGTLVAERGSRTEEYALKNLEYLRLSYAPKNTQRLGFSCFLRMIDGRSIVFSNLDWRSLVENARQDEPYARFVTAVVETAARANPKARFLAGTTTFRHTLFSFSALVMIAALAYLVFYLVGAKNWPLALLALGLLAWIGFYAHEYRLRNRPGSFAAGAIPAQVLPTQVLPAQILPAGEAGR